MPTPAAANTNAPAAYAVDTCALSLSYDGDSVFIGALDAVPVDADGCALEPSEAASVALTVRYERDRYSACMDVYGADGCVFELPREVESDIKRRCEQLYRGWCADERAGVAL